MNNNITSKEAVIVENKLDKNLTTKELVDEFEKNINIYKRENQN